CENGSERRARSPSLARCLAPRHHVIGRGLVEDDLQRAGRWRSLDRDLSRVAVLVACTDGGRLFSFEPQRDLNLVSFDADRRRAEAFDPPAEAFLARRAEAVEGLDRQALDEDALGLRDRLAVERDRDDARVIVLGFDRGAAKLDRPGATEKAYRSRGSRRRERHEPAAVVPRELAGRAPDRLASAIDELLRIDARESFLRAARSRAERARDAADVEAQRIEAAPSRRIRGTRLLGWSPQPVECSARVNGRPFEREELLEVEHVLDDDGALFDVAAAERERERREGAEDHRRAHREFLDLLIPARSAEGEAEHAVDALERAIGRGEEGKLGAVSIRVRPADLRDDVRMAVRLDEGDGATLLEEERRYA